ncbi:hypothetical protein M758_3G050100 [Ceratodon purpureus]|uniref:Deoxyhypusine synthase n=1 Tax=Ceratodon purpureus TaxID=3225 RepID=A0A8T0II84_CERPU|nr:hypothetical protein KC19_3G047400 [Ceratodon purpureus]KAG0621806.1 hypothetical protein M758_3G050100 [Ceratodon purpureus]
MDSKNEDLEIREVVLKASRPIKDLKPVFGYDFNNGINLEALLNSLASTGFQATNLGRATEEVNRMLNWRLNDDFINEIYGNEVDRDSIKHSQIKCKIFLGCTSNIISSGVRESIRFLVEHKQVDVLVTTAGGVEEDIIKCLANTYIGDFSLKGASLREQGLNRIGNLLLPNENYCKFEDWLTPILDNLLLEQQQNGTLWTPSKVIARLGKEINHPESICYWAQKNNIPIYCPALTDGSFGDMLYMHLVHNTNQLVIDIAQDIKAMNSEAVNAKPAKTGMIILGGGLPKHHICNANLMRGGADFGVYINTAQEYDGSDSGASPDEAVSWGKIRSDANVVKVHCDATIAFPLLVAQTFAQRIK